MTARRATPRAAPTRNLNPFQGTLMRGLLRFLPSEIDTMARSLLDQEQEAAQARIRAGVKPPRQRGTLVKVSPGSVGLVLDRIGRRFDISGRQLRKIMDICEAAKAEPERYGHLVEEMDARGKVDGPWTKLQRLQDAERVRNLAPVTGRFRTLVFDVPWNEDNISEAAGHAYALMSFDAILDLRELVDGWADPSFCHLWFWATNNTLGLAFRAIEHYGFQYKTVHTWTKRDFGRGRYARNTTEHVLFAVRGDQPCQPAWMSTRTDHDWGRPEGPESSKPEGFYDMVRALSYGPFGEAFQRAPRPDFVNLYQAAPAPALEAAE